MTEKRICNLTLSPRLHTPARAVLTLNYVNQIHSENIPNKTPTPLAIRISNLPSTGSEELLQLPPCQAVRSRYGGGAVQGAAGLGRISLLICDYLGG